MRERDRSLAISRARMFKTRTADPVKLGFQRVEGYTGPGWPDPAKHSHLDFAVADVEAAVSEAVALGASRPDYQPGGGAWVVLTDPEGHTFCLVAGD